MEKIVIIGGGIIGMTLANYLDTTKYQVTVVDDPTGQATKASAGIISPWPVSYTHLTLPTICSV